MAYPNRGNVKMRGKKLHVFSCKCCWAWNEKRFPSKRLQKKIQEIENLENPPGK
jgi:hypothetical protein